MKKLLIFFCIIILCFIVFNYQQGRVKTSNIIIEYDDSEIFSKDEITSAMNIVIVKFKDFKGCELIKLWYDENESNIRTGGNVNEIILYSDFNVDSNGGDGSFSPNETCTDWIWVLTRDSKTEKWKVINYGYGM